MLNALLRSKKTAPTQPFLIDLSCIETKVTVFSLCAVPALAVNGPCLVPQINREDELEEQQSPEEPNGLLDSILWMAAPKKRRTIEVNRTRRRAKEKLLKVQVH